MNILLTSVGRRSYLVKYFKCALGNDGEVHVSNSDDKSPAFKYADKSIVTPLIYKDEYIPFLLEYCKQENIKLVISLFDIDLPILSKNKDKFKKIGVDIIVSDVHVIDKCNDKLATYKFLIENGFNTPKTYIDIDECMKDIREKKINYPLIIKPRFGMGSIGVFEAENKEELDVLYNKTMNSIKNSYLKFNCKEELLNDSVIIQEKIIGEEYGLDVINDLNGAYQNTIVKKKHAMRAGETDCAEIIDNIEMKKIGKLLSERLSHISNLDVDVFYNGREYYILEMNARFGGGYPFTHLSGVDLPSAIIKWVQNEDISENLLTENVGVIGQKDIELIKL